jgi:hypothetical protein
MPPGRLRRRLRALFGSVQAFLSLPATPIPADHPRHARAAPAAAMSYEASALCEFLGGRRGGRTHPHPLLQESDRTHDRHRVLERIHKRGRLFLLPAKHALQQPGPEAAHCHDNGAGEYLQGARAETRREEGSKQHATRRRALTHQQPHTNTQERIKATIRCAQNQSPVNSEVKTSQRIWTQARIAHQGGSSTQLPWQAARHIGALALALGLGLGHSRSRWHR